MTIKNGTVAGRVHDIVGISGHITIDASTTEGTFHILGGLTYTNNGGPNVVIDDEGLVMPLLQDLHDEAFGKWILDPDGKTMTLYKGDGVTVLQTFNLTEAAGAVPAFIERAPA